ncbi:MAG: aminotransferase class IV, partial [Sedimentisphaerales bacterium]|nr:aminotransferase class IV [Sedimentisphaerales bacterium]
FWSKIMQLAMIEDRVLPFEKLDPAYCDRGTFFGDGVYEVMRSYDGKLFAFEEHIQRFAQSLAGIEIDGIDLDLIRSRVRHAFEQSKIPNAKIYWHITRGSGPRDHCGQSDLTPNFLLTVMELDDAAAAEEKKKGITVSTHPDWRWKRCDIKSLNLLANVLARRDAQKKGCSEAILFDEQGLVTEGSASAFFIVFEQTLQTVPLTANILPSITRAFVLDAAHSVGLTILEKSFTPQQAATAAEMFIAVTTKDIIPVVKFDESTIGNGTPGPYTKKLTKEFRNRVGRHCS